MSPVEVVEPEDNGEDRDPTVGNEGLPEAQRQALFLKKRIEERKRTEAVVEEEPIKIKNEPTGNKEIKEDNLPQQKKRKPKNKKKKPPVEQKVSTSDSDDDRDSGTDHPFAHIGPQDSLEYTNNMKWGSICRKLKSNQERNERKSY
jgi:hypothetical protein